MPTPCRDAIRVREKKKVKKEKYESILEATVKSHPLSY